MSSLLEGLNDAQKDAVTHGEGPLLIVAGAGTGKTTVLTRRYAYLLQEKGLKPENILALTFTEKAAGEMEDRVLQLLPNGTYDFWISTFHGFCQRILEEKGLEIGLPNRFKLLTDTDGWLMLKRRLEELPLDHYRPLGNPQKFLGALLQHISRSKDENISPEDYRQFVLNAVLDGDSEFVESEKKRLLELSDLLFFHRKAMRDEGALDFGDLIQETLRLLRERPAVLKELRDRFKYVMVDEFQDTNWAQYELVKLIAGSREESEVGSRKSEVETERSQSVRPIDPKTYRPTDLPPVNLTVVGDDDQAIYKFRGASLANILQFRDDYPDAKTVYLTSNYRSKQEILDLAYRFILQNNPNRLEVKLQDTGLSKELTAFRESGGGIHLRWYPSIEEEAYGVSSSIVELKAEDPELSWNDIAILVRSNDGAEPFVRALESQGIPFRFYALRGLYAKPVILDVIALLKSVANPADSVSLWRVINMPMIGLSAQDVSALMFHAETKKGIPLWQACKEISAITGISDDGKKCIMDLVSKMERLSEDAKREPPLKLLQLVLENIGLLSFVLKQSEQEKIEQVEWLNSFANRIKRYESITPGAHLKGFLDELQLEIDSGEEGALKVNPDEGPELVKILTIHASKGLEFKHVFIVSMVDQRFPTRRRTDAIPLPEGLVKERLTEGDAHLEEERRLFYVAITRAKDSVIFTGADDYGGTRQKKPSPFLAEAGLTVSDAHRIPSSGLLSLKSAEKVEGPAQDVRELFPLKRRFSYTQLAAFRSCPLQYKFAHIYRIPILGSHNKSFGQSVHLALHDILKLHADRGQNKQGDLFGGAEGSEVSSGFRVTIEEAEEIYRAQWIDEWYKTREQHDEFFAKGLSAIRTFVRECIEHPPKTKALELPFDWHIGQHSIKGAIDRIDECDDGSITIYDYKTGKAKQTEDLEKKDKEQLHMYQLAMEEKGERVSQLKLVYILDHVVADVSLLEGNEKIKYKEGLLDDMNEILTSDFRPCPSSFVCQFCDFKNICEHRKL